MQDTIETKAMQLAKQQVEPIDPATISFQINGKPYFAAEDLDMPLVWFLRDQLRLTGTKFACGDSADCGGICSVLVDGKPTRACRISLQALVGKQVLTIEGLDQKRLQPLQQAWLDEDVPQCGYCDPAWIIQASALLARTPRPSTSDLNRISVVCRCGSQPRAHKAILLAAERLREVSR